MVGGLKPGVGPAQAASELAVMGQRLAAQYPEKRGVEAALLDDVVVGKVRRPLWLLLSAVGVLL